MKASVAILFLACLPSLAFAESLVALTEPVGGGQGLYTFDSAMPSAGAMSMITGLGANEQLVAIDFRPLNGQLYGLSSGSSIYTIDSTSGVATKVGTGFSNPLMGSQFGFDFNPVIDRIRIVSDADQNMVAHPDTGNANIAATTPVFYAAGDVNVGAQPNVVHHAYDGNVLGQLGVATQLRAIDTRLDILVTQANNAGTLATIGPLGIDASDWGGFDVATSGNAYATFADASGSPQSALYSINLSTGAASSMGMIPQRAWGLAAVPVPEPNSALLLILSGLVSVASLRRGA